MAIVEQKPDYKNLNLEDLVKHSSERIQEGDVAPLNLLNHIMPIPVAETYAFAAALFHGHSQDSGGSTNRHFFDVDMRTKVRVGDKQDEDEGQKSVLHDAA